MSDAEQLAQRFHESYERLAPKFSYETREASAVPWADVPQQNKDLMIAVAQEIISGQQAPGDPRKIRVEITITDGTKTTTGICDIPKQLADNANLVLDPVIVQATEILKEMRKQSNGQVASAH